MRSFLAGLRSRLGFRAPLLRQAVLGHTVVIRQGTLRERADYDDAWNLACAAHATEVIDVGAHVGDTALLMLLSTSVRRVILVEPNPEALAAAAECLIRNGLSARAAFVPGFAADSDGERVELWTVGTGAAGSMFKGHALTAVRRRSSMQVPTLTVDRVVEDLGAKPDYLKVDVEGAEAQVLAGARRVAENGARFLVEMHSNPELSMVENARRVLEWCVSLDYAAWYLKEHCRLRDTAQVADRGRCHLLLQPAAWDYPSWLATIPQGAPLEAGVALRTHE